MTFVGGALESQREVVTPFASDRVGTLSSFRLLPYCAFYCTLALHLGHLRVRGMARQNTCSGVTDELTMLALNKMIGLTLLWGRNGKTLGCPKALGILAPSHPQWQQNVLPGQPASGDCYQSLASTFPHFKSSHCAEDNVDGRGV